MTLDEAIEYISQYAEKERKKSIKILRKHVKNGKEIKFDKAKKCEMLMINASEHTKLAEWLKELKGYKDNESRWISTYNEGVEKWKCEKCGYEGIATSFEIKAKDVLIKHCDTDNNILNKYNFCPNCGADMRMRGDE